MMAQQFQVNLPAKALEEIRQMAKDRQADAPSPRGAAEFNFHEPTAEGACVGSNDDVVEVSSCTLGLSADIVTNYDILRRKYS